MSDNFKLNGVLCKNSRFCEKPHITVGHSHWSDTLRRRKFGWLRLIRFEQEYIISDTYSVSLLWQSHESECEQSLFDNTYFYWCYEQHQCSRLYVDIQNTMNYSSIARTQALCVALQIWWTCHMSSQTMSLRSYPHSTSISEGWYPTYQDKVLSGCYPIRSTIAEQRTDKLVDVVLALIYKEWNCFILRPKF